MTLPDGVEAWAVDKVRSSESVRSLLDHLLENTFIVRDFKTAIRLRKELPHYSFTTLDGNFISAAGFISGGAGEAGEASSLLARLNEIKDLESQTVTLKENLDKKQNQINDIKLQVEIANKKLESATLKCNQQPLHILLLKVKKLFLKRERALNQSLKTCS